MKKILWFVTTSRQHIAKTNHGKRTCKIHSIVTGGEHRDGYENNLRVIIAAPMEDTEVLIAMREAKTRGIISIEWGEAGVITKEMGIIANKQDGTLIHKLGSVPLFHQRKKSRYGRYRAVWPPTKTQCGKKGPSSHMPHHFKMQNTHGWENESVKLQRIRPGKRMNGVAQ